MFHDYGSKDVLSRIEQRLRDVSQALFGSGHRLEVARAIADIEPGVFYARQIAELVGIPDNVAGRELARLERAGLVIRLEAVQRAQYLERQPSCFWDFCRSISSEVADRGRAGAAESTESPQENAKRPESLRTDETENPGSPMEIRRSPTWSPPPDNP